MVPQSAERYLRMKKRFVSFLTSTMLSMSLCLILVSCSSPQLTATPTSNPTPTDIPLDDLSIFKNGLIASQQHVLNELRGPSIYHLEFNIADDMVHVIGHEEVKYTNTETVALDKVELRLFPNILGGKIDVSNISIGEQSVTPNYDLENSLLILPFAAPLEPNQSIVIKMDFADEVPQSVDQNYGVLAYYDHVLALAHSYPIICVYNEEGWNAEIPPQSGDVTFGDAAFFIVKINAPKGITLVTTGSEISRDEAGQTQSLTVADGPARDFYLVASPAYKEVSQKFGEVTIHSYAMDGSEQGAQMALDVASKAIDVYSKRYAPFPYTEFDIVATPTLALGIEYPGMVAIASRIYDVNGDYRGDPARIYMEATVAHEVSHQWFYNLVGDDQLDEPWLDESFAQFATLQYYMDEYGPQGAEGFRSSLEGRWAALNDAKIPIGLPVAKYTDQEYGAIVYGRGALFLVALKEKMGASVFDEFMKDYTTQLSWGIATPAFMQSLAEKHCACDLNEIFKEWVYP